MFGRGSLDTRLLIACSLLALVACADEHQDVERLKTAQIEIADMLFDVDTAGELGAEPVLLLHGFPQNSHAWRHQLPELAANGYFAMAPNQRGYSAGARPLHVEDYATEALVADALAIAKHFGYQRFHLVGHDWGGQLAWLLAASHPDRVLTLSVLSRPHPEAFLNAMNADQAQSERSGHHRAFQSADAAERLLADDNELLRNALQDQGVSVVDADAYLDGLATREAMDAAINWYRAGGAIGRTLRAIVRPTLYIWGDADATVGRLAAVTTGDYVTAPYTFVELAGVGHFSTDQAPDAVNRALLRHLATNR
jgi:pimeloyl-ACP methyl ester carboxylesterase